MENYGLFTLESVLLKTIYEEDDKHALIKALCLAECDFSAMCKKGFILAKIDSYLAITRMVADVRNIQ